MVHSPFYSGLNVVSTAQQSLAAGKPSLIISRFKYNPLVVLLPLLAVKVSTPSVFKAPKRPFGSASFAKSYEYEGIWQHEAEEVARPLSLQAGRSSLSK